MKTKFGNKIIEARLSKNLTQENLAEITNISIRTIQRIEKNETTPRKSTIKVLNEKLNLNLSEENLEINKLNVLSILKKVIYFILSNILIITIYGYFTVDNFLTNFKTKFAALLLSIFISWFIVRQTSELSGRVRLLRFELSLILWFMYGFYMRLQAGENASYYLYYSGVLPIIITSSFILFYGDKLKAFKN